MSERPAAPPADDWVREVFPTAELARGSALLPVGSRRRDVVRGLATRTLDVRAEAQKRLRRIGREVEAAAARAAPASVLVTGVYRPDGVEDMVAAVRELQRSKHRLRFALGATGSRATPLAGETAASEMAGGKFANLNRLLAGAGDLPDWLLLIDDDVELPAGFLDGLVGVAEALRLDLSQPALTWRSYGAWRVTRQRAFLARRTRFVEIGPVTLMRREVAEVVTPFSEVGMGWGQCLHWAALAKGRGWGVGIVDALAIRHERRATASAYGEEEALEAAREYLSEHDYISFAEADETLQSVRTLPRPDRPG